MYREIHEFCFLLYAWCIVKSLNFVSCFMLDILWNPRILFPALCLMYRKIPEFCFLLYASCIVKSTNFVSCFMLDVSWNPWILFPALCLIYCESLNFVSCFMLDILWNPWILFPALCLIYCEIHEFCFLLYAWCIVKSLRLGSWSISRFSSLHKCKRAEIK